MGVEATPEDTKAIVDLGRELFSSSPRFKGMGYSEQRVAMHVDFCREKGFLRIHRGEAGVVDAVFMGIAGPKYFSETIEAVELVCFASSSMPRGRAAFALSKMVAQFVAWAKSRGAKEVVAGNGSNINVDEVRRLYSVGGFEPGGEIYVRRL